MPFFGFQKKLGRTKMSPRGLLVRCLSGGGPYVTSLTRTSMAEGQNLVLKRSSIKCSTAIPIFADVTTVGATAVGFSSTPIKLNGGAKVDFWGL